MAKQIYSIFTNHFIVICNADMFHLNFLQSLRVTDADIIW